MIYRTIPLIECDRPTPPKVPSSGAFITTFDPLRRTVALSDELGLKLPKPVADSWRQVCELRSARTLSKTDTPARIAADLAAGKINAEQAAQAIADAQAANEALQRSHAAQARMLDSARHQAEKAMARTIIDHIDPMVTALRATLGGILDEQAKCEYPYALPHLAARYEAAHALSDAWRFALGSCPGAPADAFRFANPQAVWNYRLDRIVNGGGPGRIHQYSADRNRGEGIPDLAVVSLRDDVAPTLDVITANRDEWQPAIPTGQEVFDAVTSWIADTQTVAA